MGRARDRGKEQAEFGCFSRLDKGVLQGCQAREGHTAHIVLLQVVHRVPSSLIGPVYLSSSALSGRLAFTV